MAKIYRKLLGNIRDKSKKERNSRIPETTNITIVKLLLNIKVVQTHSVKLHKKAFPYTVVSTKLIISDIMG